MKTHKEIDQRSLFLAQEIVKKIERDPDHAAIKKARNICLRWKEKGQQGAVDEWLELLQQPWEQIRAVLLDTTEKGKRLRQSSPFCGVLSAQDRWELYRKFNENETA